LARLVHQQPCVERGTLLVSLDDLRDVNFGGLAAVRRADDAAALIAVTANETAVDRWASSVATTFT